MNKNIKVIQYRIISTKRIQRCPDENLFSLYNIKERSRKRIYYKHPLFSRFNQEGSKHSMTCQNNSVQNQEHKQHVIVNMLFQKVIFGNVVNKAIYGNIVNMMLKIIEHPIYNNTNKSFILCFHEIKQTNAYLFAASLIRWLE